MNEGKGVENNATGEATPSSLSLLISIISSKRFFISACVAPENKEIDLN